MKSVLPFSAFVLILVGCTSHVPEPLLADAGGDETALRPLRTGRRLYIDKCGGCHRIYDVEAYSDRDWSKNVRRMIQLKKVRLTEDEKDLIVKYLGAVNGRE